MLRRVDGAAIASDLRAYRAYQADLELVNVAVRINEPSIDELSSGRTYVRPVPEALSLEGDRDKRQRHCTIEARPCAVVEDLLEHEREVMAVGSPRCGVPGRAA